MKNYFEITKKIEELEKELGLKTKIKQQNMDKTYILVERGLTTDDRLIDIRFYINENLYYIGTPISDEYIDNPASEKSIQEAYYRFGGDLTSPEFI
jgi:hypothetical protein